MTATAKVGGVTTAFKNSACADMARSADSESMFTSGSRSAPSGTGARTMTPRPILPISGSSLSSKATEGPPTCSTTSAVVTSDSPSHASDGIGLPLTRINKPSGVLSIWMCWIPAVPRQRPCPTGIGRRQVLAHDGAKLLPGAGRRRRGNRPLDVENQRRQIDRDIGLGRAGCNLSTGCARCACRYHQKPYQ